MNIFLYLIKYHLISVYFFIKLIFRQKKQVLLLSRQSDLPSLNYKLLIGALEKENISYKIVCKKVNVSINDSLRTQGNYYNFYNFFKNIFKNFKNVIDYYLSLYKQMRLIASSKVIIVDGYNLPVCLLKHKKGTKVIQMWHALGAVKKFGYQTIGNKDGISHNVANILKMHQGYDFVLSGSEGMNPFFAEAFNIDKSKVLTIGTPTVDYMLNNDSKKILKIKEKLNLPKNKINVLYSPTFRNDKSDGLGELIKYFNFDKCNLLITFHPKVEDNLKDNRIIKIDSKRYLTYDILKIVDYVITDYSALTLDALVANKKILLYVFDYEKYGKENGINIDLLKFYPNITKTKAEQIAQIINNDSYDIEESIRFKEKYGPMMKNSTKKIIALIKECLYENNKKCKKNRC